MSSRRLSGAAAIAAAIVAAPASSSAAEPTAGYPEAVVQWNVQKRESCEDIARSLYGSARHVGLVVRYNRIACAPGVSLPEGLTLVMPAAVTQVPDARLRSINPDVRARPPGGGWGPAAAGQPLVTSSSVNTLEGGRADLEFIDRTHVYMAPNTLVVIYGTANQTRVSKSPPPVIELDVGEVKAGLAAMRGEPVAVAVKGGGRVQAASRDAVVERKGERTTVAVFDGDAKVTSGGQTVKVPKDFGTRFVGNAAPSRPRALPPAPAWVAGGSGRIVLGTNGEGTLDTSWSEVPAARSYRFEVARDEGMGDLVVREEVPASIHAFHAEKMPPGKYFITVRAIDTDEYLGVASAQRAVEVVGATFTEGAGSVGGEGIEASPYAILALTPSPRLELAVDEGTFMPLSGARIDLAERAPGKLRLRVRGGTDVEDVKVAYARVAAKIEAPSPAASAPLDARVTFEGLDGVDVGARVSPRLRVRDAGRPRDVALAAGKGGAFAATVPVSAGATQVRIDAVDSRGRVLGTWERDVAATPALPAAPARFPRLGLDAPPVQPGASADIAWWSPTATDAVVLGGTGGVAAGDVGLVGHARATGQLGPVGVEAALRSNATGEGALADSSAWFGVRARAARWGLSQLEMGPALRLGVPVTKDGPAPRLEPAFAVGGASGRYTWLADAGARIRLGDPEGRAPVPSGQGFLLAGGTLDVTSRLRAGAVLDAHVLDGADGMAGRGGLSLGLEAGESVFGAATARVSPWSDGEGHVSLGLSLGVRQP